ncbi:MAG: hypothetical protein Kow0068_14250 [Marinilabiliales bacterium]
MKILKLLTLFIFTINSMFSQKTVANDSIELEINGVKKKFAYTDMAAMYIETGIEDLKSAKYDYAIEDFKTALSFTPDNSDIYYYLGLTYYFIKDYEQSILLISRAIELNSDNIAYYNQRGISYSNYNMYDQALADFEKMLELDPNSADANLNIGSIYLLTEDYQKACQYINKAVSLNNEKALYLQQKYCSEKDNE